ncbi:isoamylase early set domain-containing protein [Sulfuriroseicoccus oceanibius]|uniref:Isoamylase early set domain-containing protein n=1 Tax=Sulfuriroseicoccus oceanibius TaxID=2707525 RepID=A0A6B3LB20_9BACT|nr:isoamylase early set domain-containing protein [Sulfuriroseicoccus oceanibius]QQL46214.1 isoamylase early set domain-containing protein [Sulfuriroseicoccus oceanibius]
MISKSFSKTGARCQVTFKLKLEDPTVAVSVLGDFNDWTPGVHTLSLRKSGHLGTSISLPANQRFAYKFLTADGQWLNDDAADDYIANEWGETNSIVDTSTITASIQSTTPGKKVTAKASSPKKKAVKASKQPAAGKKITKKAPKKSRAKV